jgi:hypothetical protein
VRVPASTARRTIDRLNKQTGEQIAGICRTVFHRARFNWQPHSVIVAAELRAQSGAPVTRATITTVISRVFDRTGHPHDPAEVERLVAGEVARHDQQR